ncbi:MAG: cobalt ECF transporter T component CbiQ [Syntrophales bacterium LBB04]|nr:cobalt ECF transporter T component CbiQ [Syntrophales bacterium LBB04]
MHLTHIDQFTGLMSPIRSMDPRAKLIAALTFILLVVVTPDGYFLSFGLYAALVWIAIAISRVPSGYILKRSLSILPFALAVSIFLPFITPGPTLWRIDLYYFSANVTTNGLMRFTSLSIKAVLSFFATITLVATTPFGELMKAAGDVGLPSKMVVVLSFMYRYLFIIVDEASHMILARDLRGAGGKSILSASGGIVGALLVRSFEHAERLYQAMLLRGYAGAPVTLCATRLQSRDVVFSAGFLILAVFGLFVGRMLHV